MSSCHHDHRDWQREPGQDAAAAGEERVVAGTPAHGLPYGANDRLGAGNLLTAERRLAALASVRTGQLFDLGHVVENGAPRIAPNQTPYVLTLSARADNVIRRRRAAGASNDAGTSLERIEMTTHVGTHIDALGHATIGDRMYGGRSAAQTLDDFGLIDLGVEHVPPMITRGVLLDVSGLDGDRYLEAGRVVTRDDLQRAADRADVSVETGDVVCVHTGWGRFFMHDNPRYVAGEPGIDEAAAGWLTGLGAVAIASDNMAVEVVPHPRHPAIVLPVHQHALVEAGVYLIENLDLAALAAARVGAFCFIALSPKLRGATGAPVRPVALL